MRFLSHIFPKSVTKRKLNRRQV